MKDSTSVLCPSIIEGYEYLNLNLDKLYYQGDSQALSRPKVSIVGSRRPSLDSLEYAFRLSYLFSRLGWTTVSGLAQGVDGIVHKASLYAGTPTIAVLAHGFCYMYPREHQGLAQQVIRQKGLLLTEYPPQTRPKKYHFVQRNRIIAALGDLTIVIQARQKSGSLTTAQYAAQYGKDVYVTPSGNQKEGHEGSFDLINQGAFVLGDVDDLLKYSDLISPHLEEEARELYRRQMSLFGRYSLRELSRMWKLDMFETYQKIQVYIEDKKIYPLLSDRYLILDKGVL